MHYNCGEVTGASRVDARTGTPMLDKSLKLRVMWLQAACIVRLRPLLGSTAYRSAGMIHIKFLDAAASVK